MLKSIKNMFDAFEKKGIVYCHWKSNEHLLEALSGDTDLDVLFLPEQRTLLDITLNECGLKRFRATPMMQYNAIEDYIGFDEEMAMIWHLHTHYRMTLGEKHLKGYTVTPWCKYILDNRMICSSGINTSSPETELVLLLVRLALKKRYRDIGRKIGSDDVVEYDWLIKHVNLEKVREHAVAMCGKNVAEIISTICQGELKNRSQLNKLNVILRKELRSFTGYRRLGSRWARTVREVNWFIGGMKRRFCLNSTNAYRRVSPSGGSVVVFLGCDGAGKSTSLAYVSKEFGKKLDVFTCYLGSGDGSSSLLRKPMKLVARKVGGKGLGHSVEKEYSEKKGVSLKSKLYSVSKIMWAITLANEKKNKLKKIAKARNNGLLVFVDRYPQIVMYGCNDGPLLTRYLKDGSWLTRKIAKWEYSIYESASKNMPDLTLKLMVPTAVAIDRKPEMTIEEINDKKTAVRAMNVALKSVEIDTSQDMSVSLGQIMKEIWRII